MLANSHTGLINALMTRPQVNSAGLHRRSDPGAGAFSAYHKYTYLATRHIPAGMELFVECKFSDCISLLCSSVSQSLIDFIHSNLTSSLLQTAMIGLRTARTSWASSRSATILKTQTPFSNISSNLPMGFQARKTSRNLPGRWCTTIWSKIRRWRPSYPRI